MQMEDQDSTRIGLLAAAAFAVLFIAAGAVVPEIPGADASAADVRGYFVDHRDGLVASAFLVVVATVPFLIFLSALRHRLGQAAYWLADSAYGAGIVLIGLGSLFTLVTLGLSLHAEDMQASTALTILDVGRFYPPVAVGVVFTLAAATAIAALRYGVLPRWVGTVSVVYAAYEVVESATICTNSGAFEPSGTVNLIGTLGFLVWALAVGFAIGKPVRSSVPPPRGGAA